MTLIAERDPLADIEETDASETASLPGAERAATEREMLSGLQLAATAAERLEELSPEDEEHEPSTERDEEPPSGPKFTTPLPPPFAMTSNGKLLLNVDACPSLKLEGRTIPRSRGARPRRRAARRVPGSCQAPARGRVTRQRA